MTTFDDRYELGERLGGGATAEVFRARDDRLGRDVAVKVFRRTTTLPDQQQRLEAEVRLLASLTHPNLVALYDASMDPAAGEQPYVVMELVEGPSLADQIPVAPDRMARLGSEIAAGLAYVHSRGIVHRDVKPANVLLTPDDRAKVADFGIARLIDDSGLTQAGLVVGTAAYLAPEQVRGQQVTGAADVYSLGLMLLEALTGRREYEGSATEAAGARLHRAPTIPTSLGTAWAQLLGAMTENEPAARPAMADVQQRLGAMSGNPTAATAVVAPPPTAALPPVVPVPVADPLPPRRRNAGWLALLGLLVVAAVIAAVVVLLLRNGDSNDQQPTTPTSPNLTTVTSTPPTVTETTESSSSEPPTTSSSSSAPPTSTSSSVPPTTSVTSGSQTPSGTATLPLPQARQSRR